MGCLRDYKYYIKLNHLDFVVNLFSCLHHVKVLN